MQATDQNQINAGPDGQPETIEVVAKYGTCDLNLSAFLYAKDHPLISITWPTPKQALFVFADSSSLQKDICGFWHGEPINVRLFIAKQRELKSRIFNNQMK